MADDIIARMELKGSDVAAEATGTSLDALLKAATGNDAHDDTPNSDDGVPAEVRKADDDAKAKVKAEDDAARAEADAAEKAKADAEAAEKAKADEAAKAKDDAAPKDAPKDEKKDDFDNIELPPHVKPKTVESFALLKQQARARVTELTGSVAKLEEDLKAANEAIKLAKEGGVSAEEKKELEELRSFRRGIDVESDPEFSKFDTQIKSNDEAIYARLLKAGYNQASIDKIMSLGGPLNVDWGLSGKDLPDVVRRFLDV
jgi:colicin import membrane protein